MEKTARETCLHASVMVGKEHPAIEFRGCMDALDAGFILAEAHAREEGQTKFCRSLCEMQEFARRIMRAHVLTEPMEPTELMGLAPGEIHRLSHNPPGGHLRMGIDTTKIMAYTNLVRTQVRTAERAAVRAGESDSVIGALNILSSAVYVLLCRMYAQLKGLGT